MHPMMRALLAAGAGGSGGGSSPFADVNALITALGGDSAVLAFHDVRAGTNLVTTTVDSWDDVRGASGFGLPLTAPSSGLRPTWDSTNSLVTATGSQALAAAASARYDLSGARSLIYVGTMESDTGNPDYYAAVASGTGSPARLMGILNDTGFSSGNIIGVVSGTGFKYGSSNVAVGTTRRVAIATKGSAANTFTIQVPNIAANAGGTSSTGGAVAAGNNGLSLFSYGTQAGVDGLAFAKGSCRALIFVDHALTGTEANAVRDWAVTNHGTTTA